MPMPRIENLMRLTTGNAVLLVKEIGFFKFNNDKSEGSFDVNLAVRCAR